MKCMSVRTMAGSWTRSSNEVNQLYRPSGGRLSVRGRAARDPAKVGGAYPRRAPRVRTQVAHGPGRLKDGAGGRSDHFEGMTGIPLTKAQLPQQLAPNTGRTTKAKMEVVRQMLPRCHPAIAQLAAARPAEGS
jgi:hypothetical protein